MKKPNIVKVDDLRRNPPQCGYCKSRLGQPHEDDCVVFTRTIMIRASFDIVVAVPDSWDEDLILFQYNEHSCTANTLQDIVNMYDRRNGCHCNAMGKYRFKVEYLREATEIDEDYDHWRDR